MRPAGWCNLIARQWHVDGVIGENGALVFWEAPSPHRAGLLILKQRFHPGAIRNSDSRLRPVQGQG